MSRAKELERENRDLRELIACMVASTEPSQRAMLIENAAGFMAERAAREAGV